MKNNKPLDCAFFMCLVAFLCLVFYSMVDHSQVMTALICTAAPLLTFAICKIWNSLPETNRNTMNYNEPYSMEDDIYPYNASRQNYKLPKSVSDERMKRRGLK